MILATPRAVSLTILVVLAQLMSSGCASARTADGASTSASTASAPRGQGFVNDPIVTAERVRGHNQFTIYLRTFRTLPHARCRPNCQETEGNPHVDATVLLSGGTQHGSVADMSRLASRRHRYCYLQQGAAFASESPLEHARPGDAVTVTLVVRRRQRYAKRVAIRKPIPPASTGGDIDGPYLKALGC